MQARQSKHCIGESTSRERERERERESERERCVLFEFFFSGNSYTYFKVLCRSLQKKKKKSDHTRCLAVSILEYNLGPKITGSEVQY